MSNRDQARGLFPGISGQYRDAVLIRVHIRFDSDVT